MNSKHTYHDGYNEIKLIGRGNFGTATLVEHKIDKAIYVAKKVILGTLSPKDAQNAQNEVKLLKELRHPHIVEYKECFVEEGVLITVMEYCEEGDLKEAINMKAKARSTFDEEQILNWFLQGLLALEFIHRRKVLHRDIKSSNIFIKSDGTIKIGDFGISKSLDSSAEHAMTVVGTPYYMSPEVCENKPYTYKSDVWALGCVLYEMCSLRNPFDAKNLLSLIYKIVRDDLDPLPTSISPAISGLVSKLLTKNEAERPNVLAILKFPIIQEAIERFIVRDGNLTSFKKIPLITDVAIPTPTPTPILTKELKPMTPNNHKGPNQVAGDVMEVQDLTSTTLISFQARTPLPGSKRNDYSIVDDLSTRESTENPLTNRQSILRTNGLVSGRATPANVSVAENRNDQLYEKQLRSVQRLIPKRNSKMFNGSAKMVNRAISNDQLEELTFENNLENDLDTAQDIKKTDGGEDDLFDLSQDDLSLSLSRTPCEADNQNNEDLMKTYISCNVKSQTNTPFTETNQDFGQNNNDDDLMKTYMSCNIKSQLRKTKLDYNRELGEGTLKDFAVTLNAPKSTKAAGQKQQIQEIKEEINSNQYLDDYEEYSGDEEYAEDFEECSVDEDESS